MLTAVSNSRHCRPCQTEAIVCCATQQSSSVVRDGRHRLRRDTADIVCYGAQQAMSAVSHSRHLLLCDRRQCLLCVAGRDRLLCDTAEMCSVTQRQPMPYDKRMHEGGGGTPPGPAQCPPQRLCIETPVHSLKSEMGSDMYMYFVSPP